MDDRTLHATILKITPPRDVTRVELDDRAKAWLKEATNASMSTAGNCLYAAN
jgi:hypothetical protein